MTPQARPRSPRPPTARPIRPAAAQPRLPGRTRAPRGPRTRRAAARPLAARRVVGQVGHVGLAVAPGGDLRGPAEYLQVVRHVVLYQVPLRDRLVAGLLAGPGERGERLEHPVEGRVVEDRGGAAGRRAA